MSTKLQIDVYNNSRWWRHLVNTYDVEAGRNGVVCR